MDASYYAVPSPRTADAWAERTPADFRFGVKAYAALTGHPLEPRRLERDLQGALPPALLRERRVYPRDLPDDVLDALWARFAAALRPLREHGKLGYVLLQMPRWFVPGRRSEAELEAARARLSDLPLAVEFRHAGWMREGRRRSTLDLLRRHGLVYVAVDEPQGTAASVPPIAAATSAALAVVRFHGRRAETWTKVGATTTERFGYRYAEAELAAWVPRLRALARRAGEVHVLMNNCHREYAVQNAKELAALLAGT